MYQIMKHFDLYNWTISFVVLQIFFFFIQGDTTQSQQPMGLFLPLCSPVKDACNNDISAGIRISTTEDESSTGNMLSCLN